MSKFMQIALAAVVSIASGHVSGALITGQGTWESTLQGRDINGAAVSLGDPVAAFFYDTMLDVTWMRDMNANGRMNWATASNWVASISYFGGGWRLPTPAAGGPCGYANTGTGCGFNVRLEAGGAYSELAHLFYVTLGNLARYDTSGALRSGTYGVDWGLVNTANFTNMLDGVYWYDAEVNTNYSASFWNGDIGYAGMQYPSRKTDALYAVAVRPGDVLRENTVPVPSSLLLVLAAMAALGVVRCHRTD